LRVLPPFLKQYPNVEIVLLNVDDVDDFAKKGIDVLVKGHSIRRRGGEHPELQGLVERKLCQAQYVACASPEYLKNAGHLRKPADLLQHACIAQITFQHDVLDQWQFQSLKSREREKVKIIPKLLAQGNDAMREAAVAGCGVIRAAAHHIDDELRSRALLPILPEWECVGAPVLVAVYRKTRPARPQVSTFVHYLSEALQHRSVTKSKSAI
jgi:DNA-binding transcriptional LysR family regulator